MDIPGYVAPDRIRALLDTLRVEEQRVFATVFELSNRA